MTNPEPLDRRRFLALLAAALGTSVAGVVRLLSDDEAARRAGGSSTGRRAGGGTGPGDASAGSTTTSSGVAGDPGLVADDSDAEAAAGVPPLADRILVLLTLHGGNDALNTVAPVDDRRYRSARGALALPGSRLLPLADGFGLHPALPRLHQQWNDGQLAVVRGVGYPNPNRSHFLSMDIWQTASPATPTVTGWIGRWLDRTGQDSMRALALGGSLPLALRGERVTPAVVPSGAMAVPGGAPFAAALNTMARSGGSALMSLSARAGSDMVATVDKLRRAVDSVADSTQTSLEAGTNSTLRQFDTVASLIRAGLPTKVYALTMGGFDTHADQLDQHGRLLGDLDAAMAHFFARLGNSPRRAGVVVAVHSEFGRRVQANGSGGTDHGGSGLMFLAGAPVRGGFHGDDPGLAQLVDGDTRVTSDFRAVYAALLEGVVGTPADVVLPGRIPPLDVLRA